MVFRTYFRCFCVAILVATVNSQYEDHQSVESVFVPDDSPYLPESKFGPIKRREEQLKAMCLKYGGEEALAKAETAMDNIRQCFAKLIDYSALPAKMNKMRPLGELDVVFKEYCQHTDEMKNCTYTFLVDIESCLSDTQKKNKHTLQNVAETILGFACEDEGDHVALFVSERGLECINETEEAIENCIKKYVNGSKWEDAGTEREKAPNADGLRNVSEVEDSLSLDFNRQQCEIGYKIRDCVIRELMACSSRTPANVLESILNLMLCSTSCAKYPPDNRQECSNDGFVYYSYSYSWVLPVLVPFWIRRIWW